MRWIILCICLLASNASAQIVGDGMGSPYGGWETGAAPTYTGPGDVVSGATAFYSPRCYSAATATGSTNVINYRRASDNSTQPGVCLTNGNFDAATAATFAGTDATASCTISATTATCTGASSTPHAGSTLAGASLTQPCLIASVGTFTGGAGTMTVELAGTTTSCGTISVAETMTATYGLFVTEAYDQSGNAYNASQATAGNQPRLLLLCTPNLQPCLFFNGSTFDLTATTASIPSPQTSDGVWVRVNAAATLRNILAATNTFLENGSANQVSCAQASSFVSATASDGTWHSTQCILNGASSGINVDGTFTSGSTSARAGGTALQYGGLIVDYVADIEYWPVAFNSTQYGNVCHNDRLYYGTPGSC